MQSGNPGGNGALSYLPGINEGPCIYDAPLKEVAEFMLKVHAGAYSFEAANARHEHEYHLWETLSTSFTLTWPIAIATAHSLNHCKKCLPTVQRGLNLDSFI
jgi:hypothetical protein